MEDPLQLPQTSTIRGLPRQRLPTPQTTNTTMRIAIRGSISTTQPIPSTPSQGGFIPTPPMCDWSFL